MEANKILIFSNQDILYANLRDVDGGRYWDRTSDPHNVNVVLYR